MATAWRGVGDAGRRGEWPAAAGVTGRVDDGLAEAGERPGGVAAGQIAGGASGRRHGATPVGGCRRLLCFFAHAQAGTRPDRLTFALLGWLAGLRPRPHPKIPRPGPWPW